MNCSGFTVFDALGNLVFRVDNYVAGSKSEILLMDASGNALFTVRRKVLVLSHMLVYVVEFDLPEIILELVQYFTI